MLNQPNQIAFFDGFSTTPVMPLLTILSDDEQKRFETPPIFTGEERKYFFTLPKWAEEVATPEGKQRIELLHQIKYSSMAVWQHINMLGEYDWSGERVNKVTQFQLSKILALNIS